MTSAAGVLNGLISGSTASTAPAPTRLILGDFEFTGLELPDQIDCPTGQRVAIQKLIGGRRRLDVMGVDHNPIAWAGIFYSNDAALRMRRLRTMADAGQSLRLTWDEMIYQVVIVEFLPQYRNRNWIPYRILLAVEQDLSTPITKLPTPTSAAQSLLDMAGISDVVSELDLEDVSAAFSEAQDVLSAAAPILGGSKLYQQTMKAVTGLKGAADTGIAVAAGDLDHAIASATQVGALFGGQDARTTAAKVTAGVAACRQLGQLQVVSDAAQHAIANIKLGAGT